MNSEGGMRSPFTVSQLQELEQQALIFKYMMAGVPVPTNLVLSIQKSLVSISNRFFHHPTMDYSSLYRKKMDPEPGRCRRTDGKKWRCTRDVYPYSKYCERHMHRGRNRSRKPVESQMQSPSTVTPLTVTGSSTEGSGSFQNLPLNSFDNIRGTGSGVAPSHYLIDSIPYGIPNKDYSYINQGLQLEVGRHSFFSNASGNISGLHLDSPLDNTWPLLQSRADTFFPTSNSGDNCNLVNECPQHSFYNSEFASEERVKHQGQFLGPFFNEWPMNSSNFSEASTSQSTQGAS